MGVWEVRSDIWMGRHELRSDLVPCASIPIFEEYISTEYSRLLHI
jgi:hypothetical protein